MIIYHNQRCSKSREALSLLEKSKRDFEIREYLKEALSKKEIKELIQNIGCTAIELVRKSESLYKEKYANKKLTESQWVKVLSENPILIERPIVKDGDKAVIGRPIELVIQLLKDNKKK